MKTRKKKVKELNPSVLQVLNTPMLNYWNLLEYIAETNHLRCSFAKIGCVGVSQDIRKAQEILINCIKYN